MLAVNPPATPSYVPSNRPICFVSIIWQVDDGLGGPSCPLFSLLDANKKVIVPDFSQLPAVTPAEQSQAYTSTSALVGDTPIQAVSRACIPLVFSIYGLATTVVP